MRAVDCQGLGGGFTFAVVQEGFDLVHKVEQLGDFGFAQCDDNRDLLGDFTYEGGNQTDWSVQDDIQFVFGNPPCSGFSMMSVRAGSKDRGDYRGVDAPINSCMWDFAEYVASTKPLIAAMESVQSAGKDTGKAGGAPLMRQLHQLVNEKTGLGYKLYHCFHNGIVHGGASVRRRYFMVLARVPFGVEVPDVSVLRVPHMREVLGDLSNIAETPYEAVAYSDDANDWTRPRRNVDGTVRGQTTLPEAHGVNMHDQRMAETLALGTWRANTQMIDVVKEHYESTGEFPGPGFNEKTQATILERPLEKQLGWDQVQAGIITEDDYCTKWGVHSVPVSRPIPWQGGAYQPRRWDPDRAGLVLAGNGMESVVHPMEDRTYTYREMARIMGFPDNWSINSYAENRGGHIVYGKGVTVESGAWIAKSAAAAINGSPYECEWEEIGQDEFRINLSNIANKVYSERTGVRA